MNNQSNSGRSTGAWPVGVTDAEWAEAVNSPAFYMTSQGYIPPLTSADVAAIKAGE